MKTTLIFNNWLEVSEWWSANPNAKRITPEIEAETIEEYNRKNHELTFPCEMIFEL